MLLFFHGNVRRKRQNISLYNMVYVVYLSVLFNLSVLELGNQWFGNTYRLCGLCGHKTLSEFYICTFITYIYIVQVHSYDRKLV